MNLFRNKLSSYIIRASTRPFLLSILLTALSFPFVNPYFPPYKVEVTNTGLVDKINGLVGYHDLDWDGNGEQVVFFMNYQGKPTYRITDQEGLVVDQQEFEGDTMPLNCPPSSCDLNRNQKPELLTFFQRHDSLFLEIVEYQKDWQKQILAQAFICPVANTGGTSNYHVYPGPQYDLDGDSVEEVLFSVMAGYPLIPRNHFAFNLKTGKLISSSYTGAASNISGIVRIDDQGNIGLLFHEYAPGNLKDSTIEGVNDQGVRFSILNRDLNPIFPPVEFKGVYGSVNSMVIRNKGKPLIALLYLHKGKPKNNTLLLVYNLHGILQAKKVLSAEKNLHNYRFVDLPGSETTISILDDNGIVTIYDTDLQQKKQFSTPLIQASKAYPYDIDHDGEVENIFIVQNDQRIAICHGEQLKPVFLDIPHESLFNTFSFKKNSRKADEVYLQFSQKFYLVSCTRSATLTQKLGTYLLVFTFLLGLTSLIQLIQRFHFRRIYSYEKNLNELQLKLVKKQVDPHFLFNVLTTLSYNLIKNDKEEAYAGIARLVKFMRSAVEWGDKIFRPLKDELEVVTTYLDLYQNQHPENFEYLIHLDDNVDKELKVPAMILQNLVENALKHGIIPKKGLGKIQVKVYSDSQFACFEIMDNGIGRKVSMDAGTSGTGKGLNLMQQYIDLLNKFNKKQVSLDVIDMKDDRGAASGTSALLKIPLDLQYPEAGKSN